MEPYDYRTSRSPELRRRNRRVGLIVALVAVALIVFTIIYVTFFGGANIGPQAPMHSGVERGVRHGAGVDRTSSGMIAAGEIV